MAMNSRLMRMTDLFTNGAVCHLGDDDDGQTICIWVSKPNSFMESEARDDARAARIGHILALDSLENPEMQDVNNQIDGWSDEELNTVLLNQKYDESYAHGISDVEAAEDWKENLDYLRRTPQLLDDASVPEDDEKRVQWKELNEKYILAVGEAIKKRQDAIEAEIANRPREEKIADFLKDYKERSALAVFMLEKRITELFYAMRVCDATRAAEEEPWDHSKCDHRNYLLDSRKQVKELPEYLVLKAVETMDSITVGYRQVSNFPKPPSGSEQSA